MVKGVFYHLLGTLFFSSFAREHCNIRDEVQRLVLKTQPWL